MALTKDQFAEQLRHHRALRGLHQKDVAQRVGVKLRTYQRWEAGERTPYKKHTLALARALDVDPAVFVGNLDTGDALQRIEAQLDENNRLLRQLYAWLLGANAQRATGLPAPEGALGRIAEDPQTTEQDQQQARRQLGPGKSSDTG